MKLAAAAVCALLALGIFGFAIACLTTGGPVITAVSLFLSGLTCAVCAVFWLWMWSDS